METGITQSIPAKAKEESDVFVDLHSLSEDCRAGGAPLPSASPARGGMDREGGVGRTAAVSLCRNSSDCRRVQHAVGRDTRDSPRLPNSRMEQGPVVPALSRDPRQQRRTIFVESRLPTRLSIYRDHRINAGPGIADVPRLP